jgi:flagellar biosynthesis protein FliQ
MKNDNIESTISNGKQSRKKTLGILFVIIIIGVITGLLVSFFYLNDANERIIEWNNRMDEWYARWGNWSWDNTTWGNWSSQNNTWGNWSSDNTTYNQSGNEWRSNRNEFNSSFYDPYLKELSYDDVILPSIAIILLCIVSYIIIALLYTYIKIYKELKSKYIQGLILVLVPLLIFSVFLIRVVKSLYFSSALSFNYINIIFGFGINGLGTIFIILSIFEIIGLSILLHLSME